MRLEIRDPVFAALAQRTAVGVDGVARLHEPPWRPGPRVRGRARGVQVDRRVDTVVVTLRIVVRRGHPVLDVVRTVQRSVGDEVRRLTGVTPEVVVVVVDLD